METKRQYTTILVEKGLKKELDLLIRRMGLRTFPELFKMMIEKNK